MSYCWFDANIETGRGGTYLKSGHWKAHLWRSILFLAPHLSVPLLFGHKKMSDFSLPQPLTMIFCFIVAPNNRVSQPWSGTSNTMNQNKSFQIVN